MCCWTGIKMGMSWDSVSDRHICEFVWRWGPLNLLGDHVGMWLVGWLVDIIILTQCHLGLSPVLTSLIYLMGIQYSEYSGDRTGYFFVFNGEHLHFCRQDLWTHCVSRHGGFPPAVVLASALVAGEILGKIRNGDFPAMSSEAEKPWVRFGTSYNSKVVWKIMVNQWLMMVNNGLMMVNDICLVVTGTMELYDCPFHIWNNPSHWRTPSCFKMGIAPPTSDPEANISEVHHFSEG
jgi:hypothetical protein